MTSRALAVMAALALLALASAAAQAATNSDAVNAIAGYDPGNAQTVDALNRIVLEGGVNVGVLRPQLRASDARRRWAATYLVHALARSAVDLRLLDSRLADRDVSTRTLAAGRLVWVGRKAAIPVLIRLLRSRQSMRSSEPPELLAALAETRLVATTGADFGFDPYGSARSRAAAVKRWEAWWKRVRGSIRWDAAAKRYRFPGRRRLRAPRPARARPASTTGTTSGSTVKVTVKIELSGRPVPEGLRQRMAAAERLLRQDRAASQTGMCFDVEISFDVRTRDLGAPATPGYHQVDVATVPPGTSLTSRADIPPVGRSGTGSWDTEDDAYTLAHETLHLMGLRDEYVDRGNGTTIPIDTQSILGGGNGRLLQRHLDFLAERFSSPDAQRACERWALDIPRWTSVLEPYTQETRFTRTNHLGVSAEAELHPEFWVNKTTGVITAAGSRPCGQLNVTAPCAGVGTGGPLGSSARVAERFDPGEADCRGQIRFTRARWETAVTGSRTASEFRLKVAGDDRQDVQTSCDPTSEPRRQAYSLIANGMKWAGAADFTMPFPVQGSRTFDKTGEHRRVSGTVTLRRVT